MAGQQSAETQPSKDWCCVAWDISSPTAVLLYNCLQQPSERVRDLGVVVDSGLTLADNVSHIIGVSFFYIQQLRLIRQMSAGNKQHVAG